jgi:hypothetical protein
MSEFAVAWDMKLQKSIHTNSVRRLLLLVPVTCSIAFAACSDLPVTAKNPPITTNRVGTYISQRVEKAGNHSIETGPDPTYEWFY